MSDTRPGSGRSVLVLDDDKSDAEAAVSALRLGGYSVRVANNPDEARQASSQFHPDLILVDIVMPAMDGFEITSKLRAVKDLRDLPIIFLTARLGEADRIAAFRVGARDYVTKPYNKDELLLAIRTVLTHGREWISGLDSDTASEGAAHVVDLTPDVVVPELELYSGFEGYAHQVQLDSDVAESQISLDPVWAATGLSQVEYYGSPEALASPFPNQRRRPAMNIGQSPEKARERGFNRLQPVHLALVLLSGVLGAGYVLLSLLPAELSSEIRGFLTLIFR